MPNSISEKEIALANSIAYTLMASEEFPSIRVGARMLVERGKFKEWVETASEC